ncbi:MbnH family di-heme enzyme [Rheinheimera sp. WS51]|uniref:MbnH family di-heme enzyme n=1 Tax=Rheinheimera sp. WS51 TaxID=3425886 RepID=UPI003D8A0351
MRLALVLLLISMQMMLTSCTKPEPAYQWQLPPGFPEPVVPSDNPMSAAKVELGRYLFYDTALSSNQSQSCASCHQQQHAFAEPKKVSKGSTGQPHRRNAQALVNVAYNNSFTWAHDGLAHIESQLLIPLFGDAPIELGAAGQEQAILARLNRQPYPELFKKAFASNKPDFSQVVAALSSFTRSLLSFNSRFDRYAYQQDDSALSQEELMGLDLFFSERLECHHCHGGFNFTQATSHQRQPLDRRPFHNTGLYYTQRTDLADMGYPQHDTGLSEVSLNPADDGRFRAPTLRNIALSAPYMHDGSLATLEQVIDFYAAGGLVSTIDGQISDGRQHPAKSSFVRGFNLTTEEKQALLAFLHSLSDPSFTTNPAYSNPWLSP